MPILGFDTLADAQREFDWSSRWELFRGDRERFNIADECLDRHVADGRGRDTAARIVHSDGTHESYDFAELADLSGRFANAAREAGIGRGDSVVIVLEPGLAYFVALFGALKAGAVAIPTSTIVSPESVLRQRVIDGGARLLVVEPSVLRVLDRSAVPADCRVVSSDGLLDWVAPFPSGFDVATTGGDPACAIYSSGTTGRPKRTLIAHKLLTTYAVVVGHWVLGLERGDRYLSTYSPGWLGGFGWGVWVPMSLGVAAGVYGGPFRPEVFLSKLRELDVNALHCPPTAYRRLLRAADDGRDLSIEKLAYTGEAMEPELAVRVGERFGRLARGQYGATEVGFVGIDYAYPDHEVRPGSIGKPLIGTDVRVVDDDDRELTHENVGWIAVRRGDRLARLGDKGLMDGDGYLWFKGRGDDVIISAGYTIGAQEVEEALRTHDAVADVAVIAKADPDRGSIVKAFVELDPAFGAGAGLRTELIDRVRSRVGRHAYPRELEFVDAFERGEGGKIRRAALHERDGTGNP